MAEYIDMGLAVKTLEDFYLGDTYEVEVAIEELKKVPTADVVPVVRCRDCKYWMDIDNGRQKHEMCAQLMPDWFCADGKRKEAEDE